MKTQKKKKTISREQLLQQVIQEIKEAENNIEFLWQSAPLTQPNFSFSTGSMKAMRGLLLRTGATLEMAGYFLEQVIEHDEAPAVESMA